MNDTDILIEKIERLTERCEAFQERNDHLWSRIEALEAALRQNVDDWRKRGRRIEALEAECDRWAEQAETTAASLRTKVKTLEAALRVFADPLSWRRDGSCDPNSGRFEGQSIARAALAPEPQK